MTRILIIGSGAAGAAAALAVIKRGATPILLDVGIRPPAGVIDDRHLLDQPVVPLEFMQEMFGEDLHRLETLVGPYLSPKLRPHPYGFVTEGADDLFPIRGSGVEITQSAALGGLANAWGAGCYAFTNDDLVGHAASADDLGPWYRELADEIGISGEDDALAPHVGLGLPLQPAHPIGNAAAAVLRSFQRSSGVYEKHGVTIGQARLAVLSRAHRERSACDYKQTTFLRSSLEGVYSPRFTIERLIREGKISYRGGLKVERFREVDGRVEVDARRVDTHEAITVSADSLIIACGTLNSARLVVSSRGDTETTVPLLDNELTLTPFLKLSMLGAAPERQVHGLAQLNYHKVVRPAVGDQPEQYVFGAMYGVASIPTYEFLLDFPLAMKGALAAAAALLPSLFLVSTFYPSRPNQGSHVRLNDDGTLGVEITPQAQVGATERTLIGLFRRAGLVSHPALMKRPLPGNGIHYAGTLPFRKEGGGGYTTDREGRLCGTRRVFVCDASVFPTLPAKNHTFTMMANAMRIGTCVMDCA